MKANELRIGNWVFSKTYGKDIEFKSFFGLCNVESNIELFEPIPLTEEWLVKFGFELVGDVDFHWRSKKVFIKNGYALFEEDQSGIIISENGNKAYCDRSYQYRNGHGIDHKVEYVHQLQNLFYSLTGEELKLKQ